MAAILKDELALALFSRFHYNACGQGFARRGARTGRRFGGFPKRSSRPAGLGLVRK